MVIHSWAESTERRVQNRRGRTPGGPPSVPYSDLDTVRTTRSGARPGRPEGKTSIPIHPRRLSAGRADPFVRLLYPRSESAPPFDLFPGRQSGSDAHSRFPPGARDGSRCAKAGIFECGIVQGRTCRFQKFPLTKQMGPYRVPGLCVSSTRTIRPPPPPPSPPPHQWDSAPRPAPAPGH